MPNVERKNLNLFDEAIIQLFVPFAGQELHDGFAPGEKLGAIAPNAVDRVSVGYALGVAGVPGILSHADFLGGRLCVERWQGWFWGIHGMNILADSLRFKWVDRPDQTNRTDRTDLFVTFFLVWGLTGNMMNFKSIETVEATDTSLVSESLAGNREAFGEIVRRYQTLICSLAYSATGSFSQSQDLAQETFVTAWKQLAQLNEPGKLRSWLCGILRNRVYKTIRSKGHEPVHAAAPLEAVSELASRELLPSDHAISKEEESILWRSLERIPETYREPLILFYRERQSVESVAASLEMTEDAVKQRLSRGRKLLHEEVLSFVEGALERTNPGRMFTLGVVAALPALTLSTAKAAAIGAAAAKGGAAAKGIGMLGAVSAIFSPLLILFGNYASYRQTMDEAHTDEERGYIKRAFRNALLIALGLSAVCSVPLFFAVRNQPDPEIFWAMLVSLMIVFYLLAISFFFIRSITHRRRRLAEILAHKYNGQFPDAAFEYRSRWSLFGLPLLHVRIGDRFDVMRPALKAWIAIGSSHAIGVIFAWGGIAVAPISVGGIAIGILPMGGIAIGVFPIGAVVLGVWAYGGLAFAWQALSACGFAWNAVCGGFVVAHNFALGGVAYAAQANTEVARQFFQQNGFFRISEAVERHGFLVMLIWVIPMFVQAQLVARARRQRERANS
ncbi:MAG TPA: sigma-70 family RNA polymerase sigma factor [Candidatus Sulfotelmatobacter sp.]|nr:sigma-70 family RNA polymerase sigma factor [Candidatus Sulfotelmatobacter sp.]